MATFLPQDGFSGIAPVRCVRALRQRARLRVVNIAQFAWCFANGDGRCEKASHF
jgi:hypothetical protein